MAGRSRTAADPPVRAVLMTALGWAGLAACLTLVFLAMRSVMDVGGACADGGPYVSAQSCPDGATPGLMLGILGGMGSAFLASAGGIAVGGIWAATPILAWSALFATLGWNFIDYGIVSAPGGEVEWGWAICGVMFWAMAAFPLLGVGAMVESGQPERPATVRTVTTATFRRSADVVRRRPAAEREELADIAAGFGAAIDAAVADVPVARDAPEPEFTEGTQALLDRLERLADMRDRGLLGVDEYETAKEAIMAELEGRS